jgi:hypothetical protein
VVEARVADVEVRPAVPVHVGGAHAGTPAVRPDAGRPGGVRKPEPAGIQVEFAGYLVAAQKQVREAVVVEVRGGDPAAVVKIIVLKDVVVQVGSEGIFKNDPAFRARILSNNGSGAGGPSGRGPQAASNPAPSIRYIFLGSIFMWQL